jgi:hypothetical protein
MYAAQVVAMQNHLTIEAGDANGMAVVGSDLLITEAWLDLNNQPDSVLTLACADVGGTLRLAPIPPTSAQGSANAATLLQTLCSQFGLTLENNGVNVQIATPYLCGAMLEQVERICQAANLSWGIEGKTLWVYPYGSYRTNQSVVDVGAGTSTPLVGYPTYSQGGLACTTLFNPNIRMGAQIKVNSSLIRAQGIWNVNGICHALESQTPGGQWFTSVQTISPNLPS